MKKVRLYEEFNNSINENYEVIFSDGMSQMKKFRSEAQALDFMKKTIASNKKLREIAVYKPGMYSTTQTEYVVAFWGDRSYLDNVSKRDPELAAKKLEEAYDGNMSDFKYEFPQVFVEVTGNPEKAIKKIKKAGKGFEVRTSIYMSELEMEEVGDAMGMVLVDYNKGSNVAISVYESKVTEAKSIAKIQKEWGNVTAIMKDTVAKYKTAEGQEKQDLLDELKSLTASKKQLEAELDAAVGLEDIDAELAESMNESIQFGYYSFPKSSHMIDNILPEGGWKKGETKYAVICHNEVEMGRNIMFLKSKRSKMGQNFEPHILSIHNSEDEAFKAFKDAVKYDEGMTPSCVSFTYGTLSSKGSEYQFEEIGGQRKRLK